MIKVVLKHWVYERCIDIVFNKIRDNFQPISVMLDQLVVGEWYRNIAVSFVLEDDTETTTVYYTNCKIEALDSEQISIWTKSWYNCRAGVDIHTVDEDYTVDYHLVSDIVRVLR